MGTHCPPFRPLHQDEARDVVERINDSGADLVWVGLSTPKQERWMATFRSRLDAPVLVGVGAAFDFHAGLKSQPPEWMQRSALEWLYRLASEPTRLGKRYLYNNPWFLLFLGLEAMGLRSQPHQLGPHDDGPANRTNGTPPQDF